MENSLGKNPEEEARIAGGPLTYELKGPGGS